MGKRVPLACYQTVDGGEDSSLLPQQAQYSCLIATRCAVKECTRRSWCVHCCMGVQRAAMRKLHSCTPKQQHLQLRRIARNCCEMRQCEAIAAAECQEAQGAAVHLLCKGRWMLLGSWGHSC